MPPSLKKAIRQTTLYADFFNATLTPQQLHHWLISPQVFSLAQIKKSLPNSSPASIRRSRHSRPKLQKAKAVTRLLQIIPTVRLVAITGSLAINNAKKDDDIDLMVVTSPHSLWISRPLALFLVSLFFNRRRPSKSQQPDAICINLWLDTLALAVPKNKQNLYTAHEVLQVAPLFNRGDTYQQFIAANSWTKRFLANAFTLTAQQTSTKKTQKYGHSFWLVRAVNLLAFRLQYLYMKSKITREHITPHSAYFHPRDFSSQIDRHLTFS